MEQSLRGHTRHEALPGRRGAGRGGAGRGLAWSEVQSGVEWGRMDGVHFGLGWGWSGVGEGHRVETCSVALDGSYHASPYRGVCAPSVSCQLKITGIERQIQTGP